MLCSPKNNILKYILGCHFIFFNYDIYVERRHCLPVCADECLSLGPQVIEPPGAGVTVGSKLPNVGTEYQTQVL